MTDIVGELARVTGAFDQPTLTLLHKGHARIVIAVFRSAFSRDNRTVAAARLHVQVDTYLDQLRISGITDLPAGSGRDLQVHSAMRGVAAPGRGSSGWMKSAGSAS